MITAIVLAAGTSTRLGMPKQLLDYQGRPLIRHVVKTILSSQVQDIIVVVGSRAEKVSEALKGLPIRIVINEAFADGQSTSVKKGVSALQKGSALLEGSTLMEESFQKGVLFALGDQPLLKTETIDLLIQEFNTHAGIIVPYYQGTRGNPVIFAEKFLPEFQLLSGDTGAKEIFRRYQEEIHRLDVEDIGVIFDIDTWEDYNRLNLEIK